MNYGTNPMLKRTPEEYVQALGATDRQGAAQFWRTAHLQLPTYANIVERPLHPGKPTLR